MLISIVRKKLIIIICQLEHTAHTDMLVYVISFYLYF